MTTKKLASFINTEDNTEGYVVASTERGFNAVLRDLDSGQTVGAMVMINSFERAVELAKQWANVR